MQIIKSFVKIILFVFPIAAFSQSTYLPQGSSEYHFLDRLEILQLSNPDLNFSANKPYSRKLAVQQAIGSDTLQNTLAIYDINKQHLLMNNSEWVNTNKTLYKSKYPILKTFYNTKANFYEVDTKDFFLAINPVLHFRFGNEADYSKKLYINSRGVTIRGRIGEKIGFSSTIIDNQERGPQFFQQTVSSLRAVPGVGFYKDFKEDKSAQDFFDARGYLTFNATKYIDFQLGYDKNFIGNGYRSMFLSDWGNSYLFAKVNTKIWKFQYQNIFMELMPQFNRVRDTLLGRKYAAMHHLSINATKWLNVGLFEGVIFGRKDHFDFQYLNPIIFYRHIEGSIGSPDNAVAGLDIKANVLHRVQFYGQLLMDEFILSKVKKDPTNWVNKFGIQMGAKYIDVLGIKNLDLQVEMNRVRPFTYSHNDSIANYTHYNQPLAHPLGANFQEWIGIIRYQPIQKLSVYARAIYYTKGLDSAGVNFGGNIFRTYTTRIKESGYQIGSGNKATCLNALLSVSYEVRNNLFIDAGLQYRTFKTIENPVTEKSTSISLGLRLNLAARQYDF